MRRINPPSPQEYPSYSSMYIDLVPKDGQVLEYFQQNASDFKKFIYSLPKEKLHFRYAQDKWTIKEIILHLIDDERIYAYRALCWARNDQTSLPGFDENDYAKYSAANERSLDSLFEEYEAVRNSTISLFQHLPETAFDRSGMAEEKRRTVRAMLYHITGHELHHWKIIRERYM